MKPISSVVGAAQGAGGRTKIHWRHRSNATPAFNEQMFDDAWLAEKKYIVSSPTAGRGASLFLNIDSADLVLRHYRRGGMVRNISDDQYIWTGLNRTRAWQEFSVLSQLEQLGLPSPRPYACQVKRRGHSYSATLITFFLQGSTLAEHVCTARVPDEYWYAIGQCIRRFHLAGVNHADLNAHNILIDDNGVVSIIDFDRAVIVKQDTKEANSATIDDRTVFKKNLHRLKRSLGKIVSSGPAFFDDNCWAALIEGYEFSGNGQN